MVLCLWAAVVVALGLPKRTEAGQGQAEMNEGENRLRVGEGGGNDIVTGKGFGLDLSTGLIGINVPINVGLLFPKFNEHLQLGLRASWSMPAILNPQKDVAGEILAE